MATTKRIFSISMVKNEMDIIESFIRYNINIFDGMIILDNGSTDNTLKILELLKSEGLPIFIINDDDRNFNQEIKTNELLLMAVNEFKADIIVPLDADEFLISSNKGNPRKILEEIKDNTYYYVQWKTYVPDFDNENEKFIPTKITLARDDHLDEFYKVIIPKELVKNYNIEITMGNHDLLYEKKYEDLIKKSVNRDLRIAHFPIRSKEQTKSKIMVNWMYFLCNPNRVIGAGFQWEKIFNKLKENEKIKKEDIIKFAKEYALMSEETEIKLKKDPIDVSFCKNIEIKYTNEKIKPISNLLESCEWLSLAYLDLKKEKVVEEERLKNNIRDLSIEVYEIFNEKNKLEKEREAYINKLKENERIINELMSSNSWKLTKPIRKVGQWIKNP